MSVKRSRTARSSSFSDVVLSRRSSPAAAFSGNRSATARPAKFDYGRPRPGILSVSSPVIEEELSREAPTANFLEKCYYCKKMIGDEDEVFMYGYLQAFCAPDCRDKQIAMDKSRGKLSGGSSKNRSDCCKIDKK